MEEITIQQVRKRSITGVFAFVSRTFILQVISLIRDVILFGLLSATSFGIFYIVESFIAVLTYFSDIGLAGALIQKKESPTEEELRTSFTIQQGIILTLVVISLLLSSFVSSLFNLGEDGLFLLQAFIIALFLSSLKTIPSVILERNLQFGKFVIPQIVETLFYSVTIIYCAWMGYGVLSFAYAVLARGISGVIAMYIICPWRVGFAFSKPAAKKLLSYGIPLQTNSVLALVKDNLLILFLGSVLPLAQVGYIGFAQKWAFTPLRLVMDNIIRVTFASFSRLQHDKVSLGKAFEKSLFAGVVLVFPALVGLSILSPYLIDSIPKYQKWEPAYLSLMFFSVNAALAAILVPLTNLLNAIGKIKITLLIMVASTIAIWVLTPLGIMLYGFHAVALVSAVVNLIVIPVVVLSKTFISFQVLRTIQYPFFASAVMGVVLAVISPFLATSLFTTGICIGIGGLVYGSVLLLLSGDELKQDIRFIKGSFMKGENT